MDYKYYEDSNGYYEVNPESDNKKTYTVKYIGVVEGSMGILSRKMRMPKMTEAAIYEKRDSTNIPDFSGIEYKAYEKSQQMHI